MPFLPETWQAKATERLWEWRLRVEQARPAVYSALSTTTLWPLVQEAQSIGLRRVWLALGNVVAGMTRPTSPQKPTSPRGSRPTSPRSQSPSGTRHYPGTFAGDLLGSRVPPGQRPPMFMQALRTELAELGNLTRFEAHRTADRAIAQGIGAVAAGQGDRYWW